jgi:hypothetical protein
MNTPKWQQRQTDEETQRREDASPGRYLFRRDAQGVEIARGKAVRWPTTCDSTILAMTNRTNRTNRTRSTRQSFRWRAGAAAASAVGSLTLAVTRCSLCAAQAKGDSHISHLKAPSRASVE